MIKILNIIGARPQIIKAAAISRAIKNHFTEDIQDIVVHTGQHYDQNMSEVFFTELGIPKPQYNLNVGSGSHASQTAEMLTGIANVIEAEKPTAVVLYGDTNSTLAGSIAASKLHVPIVHIEAGLRSFNKTMPEEVNRIITDHTATMLFAPTQTAIDNLQNEGFGLSEPKQVSADSPAVYHCGDIMYDNSLYFSEIAEKQSDILLKHKLTPNNYILATVHRNSNTDVPEKLASIFEALLEIAEQNNEIFVLPLHPRTKKQLELDVNKTLYNSILKCNNILIITPASFLEMTLLEKQAKLVVTDSGGVQKEAYFFKKPVIVLRPETEWVEIVEEKGAIITDSDKSRILEAYQALTVDNVCQYPELFGNGKAAEFICSKIIEKLS